MSVDKIWVRGIDSDDPDAGLPMDRAINKLLDEVTAVHMMQAHGRSRELSFVISRLEEARLWAIAYGEKTGTHVIMPKAEILRAATAEPASV